MEPEVHIIEKYFQEILHCFTMTNIRCKGGKEIDLLAINPIRSKKYHIESRVSTTFKLKKEASKKQNGTTRRDGLDYFRKEKFGHPAIAAKIRELFGDSDYEKVLVVYKTEEPTDSFIEKAFKESGIRILLISDIITDLKEEIKVTGSRDDVIRFVELTAFGDREYHKQMGMWMDKAAKESGISRTDLWKRLRKLRKIEKRADFVKALGMKKKTSTQRLREECQ